MRHFVGESESSIRKKTRPAPRAAQAMQRLGKESDSEIRVTLLIKNSSIQRATGPSTGIERPTV